MVDHEITLTGLGLNGEGRRPTLLERTDQEFLAAVLDELRSGGDLQEVSETVAETHDETGTLKLFQPLHRTFHIVLVEARCKEFGAPRLDPARIDSAGLLVRRLETETAGDLLETETLSGWRQDGNALRGWVKFDEPLDVGDQNMDPDPSRRPPAIAAGNAEIDRRLSSTPAGLAQALPPLSEDVAPLFVAPPDVCRAAGRTVLYGVVPVTSSESSESPVEPFEFPPDKVENLLSILLTSRYEKASSFKSYQWLGKTLNADNWESFSGSNVLRTCLEQLSITLDAFGSSPQSTALIQLLDEIRLQYGDRRVGAGELLRAAADVLIYGKESTDPSLFPNLQADEIPMPKVWPAIDGKLKDRIVAQVSRIVQSRMSSITPGEGRFDRPGGKYCLRTFIRVRRSDGCPPRLVWSERTEPFTISPWYDGNERVKPTQIDVPDPFVPGFFDKLKPNVAFNFPERMFDMLDGLGASAMNDLLDGKKPKQGGGGFGLGWICGLNISIVFLVALIVMFIFLILLNIVFFWLPFVKICIPFPKNNATS